MKTIQYELTTLAPVLISSNAGSTFAMETLTTIPGRTILGVFASMFIKKNKLGKDAHTNETFSDWFLNGKLKFTQAVPLILHPLKNELIPGEKVPFCIKIKKEDNTIINLFQSSCSEKTRSLEKLAIKVSGKHPQGYQLKTDNIKTKINFHHARDREKGSAKEGDFFAYESINPGSKFIFEIIGENTDLESFIKKFNSSVNSQGFEISVGKSRTAEYGTCIVKLLTSVPKDITLKPDLEQALSDNTKVICILNSPAVILNDFGIPTTDIACLKKTLGLKIKQNHIILKQEINEKFTSVWGFKTPSELALSPGSCFEIELDKQNQISLKDRIKSLTINGIGERTHEGFGRLSFIPFNKYDNTTYDIDKINMNEQSATPEKPGCPMPDNLKNMVTSIYINHLNDQEITCALQDSLEFFLKAESNGSPIPTSLCSRLLGFAMNNKLKSELSEFEKDKNNTKAALSLKSFYNKKSNLLKHLKKKINDFEELTKQKADMKNTGELFQIDLEKSIQGEKLLKTYMTTFFSSMRKQIIGIEKESPQNEKN